MQRLAINRAARDLAFLIAEHLTVKQARVLLVQVVRREGDEQQSYPVYWQETGFGIIELDESEIILAIQLCRVAQIDYLVLVCPDDVFSSHPASARMGSIVVSRQEHEPEELVTELLGYLDTAGHTGRPMLWIEVIQGEHSWQQTDGFKD
ncbi:hypothetical protein [Deinococcus sp.]|uniref:hypothetical protein n=1 Tax=Deinococcus sp. TaxID=47478 RepID=UPI0025C437C7|nr:hypothetical protein [Deinococcus sp.]